MYSHGFATLFLAECYGMSKRTELRDKLSLAVKLIVNSQNKEGGWRYYPKKEDADISVTVCQVMALRAAHNAGIHVPKETIDRARRLRAKAARTATAVSSTCSAAAAKVRFPARRPRSSP